MIVRIHLGQVHLEDAGGVVHRTTLQTCEGKDGGVERLIAAKGFILRAAGRFVADQVGVGAAESRGTYRLMGIDHDVMLGGLGHGVEIMVVHPLAVMMLAARDDVADITRLHGIVAVLVHKLVGLLHMALVIAHRRRGLVVHHQFYPFGMSILVQCIDVEVRIGRHEIEYIILAVAEPVLPADVPALDEQLVEAVLGCEVDVFADIRIVGGMQPVRFGLGIVHAVELDGGDIEGVRPGLVAGDHFPPYAHILDGLDPGGVGILAGFVEV